MLLLASVPLPMTKPTNRKPPSKRAEPSAVRAPAAAKAERKAAEPSRKDSAAKKSARSDDLRLKVTGGLKQRFKQAAKAAGVKKGVLLEQLLTEWEKRQPGLDTNSAQAAYPTETSLRASATLPGPQAKRSSRGA